MITVITQPQPCVVVNGTETIAGSAYRLVHAPRGSIYTDNIYIRTYGDQLLNLSKPGHRVPKSTDSYVEVDLNIIVKEKS